MDLPLGASASSGRAWLRIQVAVIATKQTLSESSGTSSSTLTSNSDMVSSWIRFWLDWLKHPNYQVESVYLDLRATGYRPTRVPGAWQASR